MIIKKIIVIVLILIPLISVGIAQPEKGEDSIHIEFEDSVSYTNAPLSVNKPQIPVVNDGQESNNSNQGDYGYVGLIVAVLIGIIAVVGFIFTICMFIIRKSFSRRCDEKIEEFQRINEKYETQYIDIRILREGIEHIKSEFHSFLNNSRDKLWQLSDRFNESISESKERDKKREAAQKIALDSENEEKEEKREEEYTEKIKILREQPFHDLEFIPALDYLVQTAKCESIDIIQKKFDESYSDEVAWTEDEKTYESIRDSIRGKLKMAINEAKKDCEKQQKVET